MSCEAVTAGHVVYCNARQADAQPAVGGVHCSLVPYQPFVVCGSQQASQNSEDEQAQCSPDKTEPESAPQH